MTRLNRQKSVKSDKMGQSASRKRCPMIVKVPCFFVPFLCQQWQFTQHLLFVLVFQVVRKLVRMLSAELISHIYYANNFLFVLALLLVLYISLLTAEQPRHQPKCRIICSLASWIVFPHQAQEFSLNWYLLIFILNGILFSTPSIFACSPLN